MRRGIRGSWAVAVFVVGVLVSCFAREAVAVEGVSYDAASVAADGRRAGECVPAEKCCKVCSAGKACGNSCISASKNCHKGRGCACNAAEVCE